VAGSSVTKAYLEVTTIEDQPPPIIAMAPANQTLPINTIAVLPCQASGNPRPSISWYKDQLPITQTGSSRLMVEATGTLVIDNLTPEDTGLYTCTASSESGETSWSASLSVENPKNPNIIFHKTPDPATFPQAPTKAKIVDRRATSVTISWRRNTSTGQSALIGYTIEYFSFDLETGWVVAAHRITSETYTIHNLKPDTSYVFLVRSENSHGMSPPSLVSERVRTLRLISNGGLNDPANIDLTEVQNALMSKVVELSSVEAISSTAIRVTWQILADNPAHVEGFFIRFRDMSGGSQKFNMKTVMNSGDSSISSHIITGLRKYTEYEVFLMPFYQKLEGQPSNSLHIQTLEDVPSAPPANLRAEMINKTSAHLAWAPPPPQHRNGVLKGYQIHVKGNGSTFHSNVTLNATTTNFVLANLSLNEEYSVRAVAFTTIGLGPFSPPTHFIMDPSHLKFTVIPTGGHHNEHGDHVMLSEPWFLALLGSVIFTVLLLVFVGIILYRRQWARQKSLGQLSLPAQHYEDMTRLHPQSNSIWINGGWKEKLQEQQQQQQQQQQQLNFMSQQQQQADQGLYAEVGDITTTSGNNNKSHQHLMQSFAGFSPHMNYRPGDPAPYATTTLAMQNRMRVMVIILKLIKKIL
jgi:roundabout axon guidance receptor 2